MRFKTSNMVALHIDGMCSNVDRNMIICTHDQKLRVSISVLSYDLLVATEIKTYEKKFNMVSSCQTGNQPS